MGPDLVRKGYFLVQYDELVIHLASLGRERMYEFDLRSEMTLFIITRIISGFPRLLLNDIIFRGTESYQTMFLPLRSAATPEFDFGM